MRTGERPAPGGRGATVATGLGPAASMRWARGCGVRGAAGEGVAVGATGVGRLEGRAGAGPGMMRGRTRGGGVGVQVGRRIRGGVSDAGGESVQLLNPPPNSRRMMSIRLLLITRVIIRGRSMGHSSKEMFNSQGFKRHALFWV